MAIDSSFLKRGVVLTFLPKGSSPDNREKLEKLTESVSYSPQPGLLDQDLQSAVEVVEELFYSYEKEDQEIAYLFLRKVIDFGKQSEWDAVASFFKKGYPVEAYHIGSWNYFFDLAERLIKKADRFQGAREIAIQLLANLSQFEHRFTRDRALGLFSVLLSSSLYKKEETLAVQAATDAVSVVLAHPCELNYKESSLHFEESLFYDEAIFLLKFLIQNHLHSNAGGIQNLVKSLFSHSSDYLQKKGAELSQAIASHFAITQTLLPDDAAIEKLDSLQKKALELAMKEDFGLFWALYCKKASITSASEYVEISFVKKMLEKVHPYFMNKDSFLVLSVGYLLGNGQAPKLSQENLILSPTLFERAISPYLPAMATALGYECRESEDFVTIRRDLFHTQGRSLKFRSKGKRFSF